MSKANEQAEPAPVQSMVIEHRPLPKSVDVPHLYCHASMERQAYEAGYVTRFREEEIERLRQERNWAEEAKYPAENEKIDTLERALRLCLHVIDKVIEVRMADQWPVLKEPLAEAKASAVDALAR